MIWILPVRLSSVKYAAWQCVLLPLDFPEGGVYHSIMTSRPYRCLVIFVCLLYILLVLWLWRWLSGVDIAQTCGVEGLRDLQSLFPYMAAGGSVLMLLSLWQRGTQYFWLAAGAVMLWAFAEGVNCICGHTDYAALPVAMLIPCLLLYLCGWVYAAARRQLTECLLLALYPPVALVSWLLSV